jgi:hypothetical protein
MKKAIKKIALLLAAITVAGSFAGCGAQQQEEEKKDYSGMSFIVGAYRDLRTDPYNNSYSIGADKFMEDYPGSSVEFVIHKNNEDLVAAIASNDVWDVQMSIMSPKPSVFKQDLFEPLDDYVDIDNPIYTKELIEASDIYDGKIYGISNVMMSDVLYCTYNENMYNDYGIKTPIEYYNEGAWNWDNFINMVDDLKKNQLTTVIQWTRPFLNMRYGLKLDSDYKASSLYDSQDQRDWLNFVRTLVYEKGIVNSKGQAFTPAKRESAFVLQIIPHMIVAAEGSSPVDTMRYIPWVSKDGSKDSTNIVDYNFCVPKGAKSIDGSVELSNYMIEACTEDRTEMYKNAMTDEDFKIFQDSLTYFYTTTWIDGYAYDQGELITEFSQGKAVSQHIAEVKDQLQAACDAHNKLVDEKASGVTSSDEEATDADATETPAAQ